MIKSFDQIQLLLFRPKRVQMRLKSGKNRFKVHRSKKKKILTRKLTHSKQENLHCSPLHVETLTLDVLSLKVHEKH